MSKKRTYGSADVEHVDVAALVAMLTVGCIVAVDVAKTKFVAAIAKATGEVLKIVRFSHPVQTLTFLKLVEAIRDAKLSPRVVMESTGTYGDALRYQCHLRGVAIEMILPKHTHDFAEVVDGVPSTHDAKAAVTLVQLTLIKPGRRWTPDDDGRRDLRALLDQRSLQTKELDVYHGHLEAYLARHWPELLSLIDVREQRSWMTLLKAYPGPHRVAEAGSEAAKLLHTASHGRFSKEHIKAIVDAAGTTFGVPMRQSEEAMLRFLVENMEEHTKGIDALDDELAQRVKEDDVASRLAAVVGPACAASIVSRLGSPTLFASAGALEKAMGLNLKVRSSGEKQGQLHITKRGPAQVRQLLYFAVLRMLQADPIVAAWCKARKSYDGESGKRKAIVAVMRKLVRALWHVAKGPRFDASKLFDVRRLDLTSASAESKVSPPTSVPQLAPTRAPSRSRRRAKDISQQVA
jgi:transposase